MRLCYVANPYSIHTQRWLRHFAGCGHKVYLIGVSPLRYAVPPGAIPPEVVYYDLMARINVRKLRFLIWGLSARRIVHQVQPDVLHAHQVAGAGWVGAAAGYHPFIVTAWGSDLLVGPRRSWFQRKLGRWVFRRADYVTCVSESLASAARALGANPAKLEVVPWGVDTSIFLPASVSTEFRQSIGLRPGPVVISIRALQALYNPLDIARAIPMVLKQVPEAQFIIRAYSYEPELLLRFQTILQEHNAAASVHFVGDLPDDHAIADLYRVADVAVSVPSSDGTPLSVLEAMACGAALVLSDVPSLREWVRDRQEGLYASVGDVRAIADAILCLLKDETFRHQVQAKGRALIQERADSRVWMAYTEDLYRRLC